MSDTKVDMPKVTQMLDSGWLIRMRKNEIGTYEAEGWPPSPAVRSRIVFGLIRAHEAGGTEYQEDWHWTDGWLCTDDFTPEQALTRLASKAHGEII